MAFIELIPDESATDEVEALYAADRARLGYVSNYTRAFAHRPAVLGVWAALTAAIKETMELRRYELATLAAARRLRSSYCALAHGSVLLEKFVDKSELRDIALDRRSAGLSDLDLAIMDLAEKVVEDATSVTADDLQRLRALGLSDAAIFDVVIAAAARCFFSKTLDALGVQSDAAYRDLDPDLQEALVVGRPIADD